LADLEDLADLVEGEAVGEEVGWAAKTPPGGLEVELDFEVDLDFELELDLELDLEVDFDVELDLEVDLELAFEVDFEVELDFEVDFEVELAFEMELDFEPDFEAELDFEAEADPEAADEPEALIASGTFEYGASPLTLPILRSAGLVFTTEMSSGRGANAFPPWMNCVFSTYEVERVLGQMGLFPGRAERGLRRPMSSSAITP